MTAAYKAAASVDAGAIAKQHEDPARIKEEIHQARITAVREALNEREN